MTHRDLQIEASQGSDKGGGGIAMYQYHIRLYLLQYILDLLQDVHSHIKQRLLIFHNGQVIVRHHMKCIEHLIQHLPVLAGNAHHGFHAFSGLQLIDQGTHLNGLRPCAEYQHDSFHQSLPRFCVILFPPTAVRFTCGR